jgi:hypothetical protein
MVAVVEMKDELMMYWPLALILYVRMVVRHVEVHSQDMVAHPLLLLLLLLQYPK